MEIVNIEDMREMDRIAMEEYAIPSILLMEHAAHAIYSYMIQHYTPQQSICIVCGPGNNGGDGFALALQLWDAGYMGVSIHCSVELMEMSMDEAVFAKMAMKREIPICKTEDAEEIKALFEKQDVLVDALFGTGLSRNVEGFYDVLILCMNVSKKPIVCVDIASGIHGDNGAVMNCAVHGSVTITFECYKKGQLLSPGRTYQGELIVSSINMPKEVLKTMPHRIHELDYKIAQSLLPKRSDYAHKGIFGKALMVGGCANMHGALTMAAQSALRSGIGTLTLFVPDVIREIVSNKLEESMIISTPSENGGFSAVASDMLHRQLPSFDFVVIGNGLGRNPNSAQLVRTVLESDRPCILDGDALYELGNFPELLKRPYPTILTPHPKEMSYICGCEISEILKDPMQFSKSFAKRYPHVVVVLKDAHTTISDGHDIYVYIGANNALAKGGSGDVLCGIIAGLYGQCKDALQAACCGVFVHGYSAKSCMIRDDANSILPSDVIGALSNTYQKLREV